MDQVAIKILESLREETPNFDSNDPLMSMINSLKPKEEEKKGDKKGIKQKEEQQTLSDPIFAPSLQKMLKVLKKRSTKLEPVPPDFIKESDEVPKRIVELEEMFKLLVAETYKNPTTKDSEEVKVKRMKEKNFNTLLLAVLAEAVKVAKVMQSRRSAPIAGPLPLS